MVKVQGNGGQNDVGSDPQHHDDRGREGVRGGEGGGEGREVLAVGICQGSVKCCGGLEANVMTFLINYCPCRIRVQCVAFFQFSVLVYAMSSGSQNEVSNFHFFFFYRECLLAFFKFMYEGSSVYCKCIVFQDR